MAGYAHLDVSLRPPSSGGGMAAMGGGVGDLNMMLIQTLNRQMGTVATQQEGIHKQQEMIETLTQQVLERGAVPKPGGATGAHADQLAAAAHRAKLPGAHKQKGTAAHQMQEAACLGVVRLDYDYPPSPGDIDHPGSFGYDVYYRVVPGLTFAICQSGKLTPAVEAEFIEAIHWMDGKGVTGITGDCGFMMYFQNLARLHTSKPVFMSSLAQLPAVTCGYASNELIAVVTANSKTLGPMRPLIKDECGIDTSQMRYIFLGCEDVPGFEAVALGEKVNVEKVTPGVVAKCGEQLKKYPQIRAFLFECTELPPYSDAVRAAFGLPVYDSITCCDFFVSGMQDNVRFGINGWQKEWDQHQAEYSFGDNLAFEDKQKLVNKIK